MKSQLIKAICDADLSVKKEWATTLRKRTIGEISDIYENSNEYKSLKDIEDRCSY